jgi:nitroreductase
MTPIEKVLDSARWAPSGDNSQPWRFVLRTGREADVVGYDTRAHCVYDLDGWASELAHGMLLETIAIAATRHGFRALVRLPDDGGERPRRYRVTLEEDVSAREEPLDDAIRLRSEQRRPMRPRRLSGGERSTLEAAAAPLRAVWFETWPARLRIAALCARNARIRLTIPEAFEAHRSVIAWRTSTSEDRMPDVSLGADPVLMAIMRHAMTCWSRLHRLNRWTGTLAPRFALDFLPGLLCSAHVALLAHPAPSALRDRIAAGRAAQRLWLAATALGLQMQPEYTPLVFARYAATGRRFTVVDAAQTQAREVAAELRRTLGPDAVETAVWLARIGPRRSSPGRSLRLPLDKLIVDTPPVELPPLAPLRG